MYQAIFFDLDGTLLPMDNDVFTQGYLKMLAKKMECHGYKPDELISAMWKGVGSMVKNDGSRNNYEAFFATFSSIVGARAYNDIPLFDKFYKEEFKDAIIFSSPSPLAKEAVELSKKGGRKVVLATNPFFPEVAIRERLRWAGLEYEDFDYVTHYENSCYCKPNPKYYLEIAEKLSLDEKSCLMVGNNTYEDIFAAQSVGMDTYLLTDYIISHDNPPKTKQGSFDELITFLKSI